MGKLDNIKRKMRNFGIESLMLYVIITIGIVWAVSYLFPGTGITSYLYFDRNAILHGQVWRVITFLFMPQSSSPFMMLINLYFYYFIGNSLEQYWGKTKFTGYFLLGTLLLIISGFITGYSYAYYLYFSMFIVYALLAPNQQFMFFFVIPIKAKYLAMLDGVFLAFEFISGGMSTRGSILACAVLILIFFGKDMTGRLKAKKRYRDFQKSFNDRNN
ncbi:MAG: hypothetical protein ACI4J5_07620 [Oscillospiraceae bacterium]